MSTLLLRVIARALLLELLRKVPAIILGPMAVADLLKLPGQAGYATYNRNEPGWWFYKQDLPYQSNSLSNLLVSATL